MFSYSQAQYQAQNQGSINNYVIHSKLFDVRLGTLYLVSRKNVYDPNLYVLKQFTIKNCPDAQQQQLERELNFALICGNTNIVRYYSWERDINTQSILVLMEYCEKFDITHKNFQQNFGGIQENDMWKIAGQLLCAINCIHDKEYSLGMNFKPTKILFDKKGNVKLNPFGLSRIIQDERVQNLIPPEITKNESYSDKSDIWILGKILEEIHQKCPNVINRKFSQDWDNFIKSMLQENPITRPCAADFYWHPKIQEQIFKAQFQQSKYNPNNILFSQITIAELSTMFEQVRDMQPGVYIPVGNNVYKKEEKQFTKNGFFIVVDQSIGQRYAGNFINDKKNGKGMMFWKNGEQFSGNWVDDKRTGHGLHLFPSGGKYEGDFKDNEKHGKGNWQLKTGEKYQGDFIEGKRNGYGVNYWIKGQIYDGTWKDNKFEGNAIQILSTGEKYEGPFKNGLKEGYARQSLSSGFTYEGPFSQGKKNGKGTWTIQDSAKYEADFRDDMEVACENIEKQVLYAPEVLSDNQSSLEQSLANLSLEQKCQNLLDITGNWTPGIYYQNGQKFVGDTKEGFLIVIFYRGEKYIGNWKNDKRNGKGVNRWFSGQLYFGDWVENKKQGKGILIMANQNRFEGDFNNDDFSGYGASSLATGDTYTGQWQNNYMTGKGVWILVTGEKYDGQMFNGKRNGYGVNYWVNGQKYEGEWKDNKRCGKGKLFLATGERYEGEFYDDKRNGKGVNFWVTGEKYDGEWKNGKKDGRGVWNLANGEKYEGYLREDKRDGHGTNYWPSGERHEGEWQANKRHGKGVNSMPNGKQRSGNWDKDKFVGNQQIQQIVQYEQRAVVYQINDNQAPNQNQRENKNSCCIIF